MFWNRFRRFSRSTMKGKWSAFYLKAFPFVRERLDQLNPQFVCFHYQLKCSLSVGPRVSLAHVWVCFISSIFVILSCLVSRLPFNVNSLTIWLAICFGFGFQYKYIRSKEHAKLNKYRVSPSINYMELYNDFVGLTHLNHVILLF